MGRYDGNAQLGNWEILGKRKLTVHGTCRLQSVGPPGCFYTVGTAKTFPGHLGVLTEPGREALTVFNSICTQQAAVPHVTFNFLNINHQLSVLHFIEVFPVLCSGKGLIIELQEWAGTRSGFPGVAH